MKDVTPKSNLEILIKCLGIAIGIVAVIALLKLALRIFLSDMDNSDYFNIVYLSKI